jgi:hypothetical protein
MKYLFILLFLLTGCEKSSDEIQTVQQEKILKEATSQTGMPAIVNFRERKLLKQIFELRDQKGLTTYTYIVAENTGKLIFLGESIGYGIPAATQYTAPSKIDGCSSSYVTVPQADPNGLFSPSSAEGTWVMLFDKEKKESVPVYVEPRIIVSPFKLD